jgi:hypothetical protein
MKNYLLYILLFLNLNILAASPPWLLSGGTNAVYSRGNVSVSYDLTVGGTMAIDTISGTTLNIDTSNITNLIVTAATANTMAKFDSNKKLGSATAGTDYTSPSSTEVFSNKTFDSSNTGNVLKFTKYENFAFPMRADMTGAIISTNDPSAAGFAHATFSGSGATNANWVEYDWIVPDDIDTSINLKIARWQIKTAGTSTSAATWSFGMADVADSAPADPTSFSNFVLFQITPSSAAANDVFTASSITLTNWSGAITAGHRLKIRVARDGSGDANNDAMTDLWLTISYGITQ